MRESSPGRGGCGGGSASRPGPGRAAAKRSRLLDDDLENAEIEHLVALEALATAGADDPAHRPGGKRLREPHPGRGAARLVLAADDPDRFADGGLGKPPVFALHGYSIGSHEAKLE